MPKMKLTGKLIATYLCVGLIPLAIVGGIAWMVATGALKTVGTQGTTALESAAFEQLTAMREMKKKQIIEYFNQRENDLQMLAELVKGQREDKLAGIAEYKTRALEEWLHDRCPPASRANARPHTRRARTTPHAAGSPRPPARCPPGPPGGRGRRIRPAG